MRRNRKRLLSLLLALILVLSLLPLSALAEDRTAAPAQAEEIIIPAVEYEVLPEILAAESSGETPTAPEGNAEEADPEAAEPERAETPAKADGDADPEEPGVPAEEAEEAPLPTEPEEPAAEETDGPGDDASEEAEEAAEPEVPDDAEEADDSDGEEEEAKEEEAEELPYGFVGMGEDYELSEAEVAAKLGIAELPGTVATLTPGVDYVEGELLVMADSADYARRVADAYDAELTEFCGFFAVIRLRSATVLQAVECAADPDIPLPAVEPNYIAQSIPVVGEPQVSDFGIQGERRDWDDWGFTDPLVSNPASATYQYHHDILGDYAAWGAATGDGVNILLLSKSSGMLTLNNLISDMMNAPSGTSGIGVAPGASTQGRTYNGDAADLASKLTSYAGSNPIIVVDAAFPASNGALRTAIQNLVNGGRIVIAPAGDSGANVKCYPAAYDGVIAVAATNASGARAYFSNYGSWCDISAPGVSLSTIGGSGQVYVSGTAGAAALVAGAAALYVDVYGTTAGFETAVKKAATKGGVGAGVLNTANLFGRAPGAFEINYSSHETPVWKGNVLSISEDGYFEPTFLGSALVDEGTTFVYTLNGKNPSMRKGMVKDPDNMKELLPGNRIDLYGRDLQMGKTYTLKVIAVNGLGISGKVQSLKFTLVSDPTDIQVEITNCNPTWYIFPGSSFTFQAKVTSVTGLDVSQSVTWHIKQMDDGGNTAKLGATISKAGKLTTKKGVSGKIVVTARYKTQLGSTVDSAPVTIILSATRKVVKTMVIDKSSINFENNVFVMHKGSGESHENGPKITLLDANGSPLDATAVGIRWTSSNPKVARVNSYSYFENPISIHAAGKGTATITATAMDGSGKSVSFKVKVIQDATYVTVYYKVPYTYVAPPVLTPGGSAQLSSIVQPGATNQGVMWSIVDDGGYGNYLTLTQKGLVKLDKNAVISTTPYIQIKATSKDGGLDSNIYSIQIRSKATAITMAASSIPFAGSVKWKSSSLVSSVTLLNDDSTRSTAKFQVRYQTVSGNYSDVDVTSSKPGLVDAGVSGGVLTLTAKAAGTSTITLKSRDGLKKYSFTVKVITPISGIQLSSAAPGGTNAVAFGKTFKLSAKAFGTYGTPTNAKLKWTIARVVGFYGEIPTASWKNLFSISQKGVLSVKKTAAGLDNRPSYAVVQVSPADYGDGSPAATYTVYFRDAIGSFAYALPKGTVTLNDGSEPYLIPLISDDVEVQLLSVISSKPALVSARVARYNTDYYTLTITAHPETLAYGKSGTAKITVKSNDGSGKTASFTVKVTNSGVG